MTHDKLSALKRDSLAEPIDCEGWVIETTGPGICQTSPIYRRFSDAVARFGTPPAGATREIVRVRTCYPMADVLAGNAVRWTSHPAKMAQSARAAA